MRWAVIDRNEEKWFVRTARVVAWLLAIPYAVLWAGRIAYGLQEAPRIYAWLTQHGLQFLDGAGFWILLALVPDFGIGQVSDAEEPPQPEHPRGSGCGL
jgi:hypothetical protein